jgi:hypothetical protein
VRGRAIHDVLWNERGKRMVQIGRKEKRAIVKGLAPSLPRKESVMHTLLENIET